MGYPESKLKKGTVVLWDSHFASDRGNNIETFQNSDYFKLRKKFLSKSKSKVSDTPYGIYVFEKVK